MTPPQTLYSTTAAVAGTPMYMAPEAVTSAAPIDGRADLYALGAVAYHLLTGTHVFEGKTIVEVFGKHVFEPPEPPSRRLRKPLPADLERIVLACLAKKPEDRPASASALRESLIACEDAPRYDAAAARKWWSERGALFIAFLIPELAWGVAQLRGYIRWNRAEARPLASLPV